MLNSSRTASRNSCGWLRSSSRQRSALACRHRSGPPRTSGLTLVEMLIAMALTLLMMAAVVSVFANISRSVSNRRASIEMTGQIRNTRGVLQRDLAGATCPGITWQRTDSNHGYIEVIEGPRSDFDPSIWLQDFDNDGLPQDPTGRDEDDGGDPDLILDLATSTLPSSNLGRLPGSTTSVAASTTNAATDGGALGDWDDILMLTVRNESEPFVGKIPTETFVDGDNNGVQDNGEASNPFPQWTDLTISSPLAEVVWFAVENPIEQDPSFYFGEPGMRTIYRRTLLIAPQLNYSFNVGGQITGPGVVRVLGGNVNGDDVDRAFAALIAFQERFDLSTRVEWDPLLGNDGRWKIVANSLADLTKRENRYEHHGVALRTNLPQFPFAAASAGSGYSTNQPIVLTHDPAYSTTRGSFDDAVMVGPDGSRAITAYRGLATAPNPGFPRPFCNINLPTDSPATPRAITDESGRVVAITSGLVPLGGARRGEDVMLSDALAFDLRVFDAKAPVLAEINNTNDANFPGSMVSPGDIGWGRLLRINGSNNVVTGRGAYVDLGYYRLHANFDATNDGLNQGAAWPVSESQAASLVNQSVLADRPHLKSQMRPLRPAVAGILDPYRVYDTWSFHYENNGVNEDKDKVVGGTLQSLTAAEEQRLADTDPTNDPPNQLIDEGTNGFEDPAFYANAAGVLMPEQILGPDDIGERETSPPYDVPLRSIQATLRAYEPDSRQVREVKVSQTFVPK